MSCSDIFIRDFGQSLKHCPVGIYLLKVNNRNTRTRYETCSKLTIKTPERRLAANSAFPQNFRIRKLGEITVFHAVEVYGDIDKS